jgi:hypothetical protein
MDLYSSAVQMSGFVQQRRQINGFVQIRGFVQQCRQNFQWVCQNSSAGRDCNTQNTLLYLRREVQIDLHRSAGRSFSRCVKSKTHADQLNVLSHAFRGIQHIAKTC